MGFIYSQLFVTPKKPTTDFSGQTIIVTGSNVGLGKEAARHFVQSQAKRVILAVRNLTTGNEAKADIESTTKRTGVVEVWKLDLSSYASVKEFATKVTTGLDRLDAIVENAGIATSDFTLLEKDESTVTVNVVSTFYLALLLLPKLQETADKYKVKPRLVIVTSEVHGWSAFKERKANSIFDTLNDPKTANMRERYPTSKLLEVLTVRQIAPLIARGSNKDVVLNMLNPGLCHSSLTRGTKGLQATFIYLLKAMLARTTEVGSRTLVASAEAGPESHGKYMHDGLVDENEVIAWVKTPEGDQVGKRVWEELSAKLEAIQPGITKNVG